VSFARQYQQYSESNFSKECPSPSLSYPSYPSFYRTDEGVWKEGQKEGQKQGQKEGREDDIEGKKVGRKEGRKEGSG
jgi:hypothetical protein